MQVATAGVHAFLRLGSGAFVSGKLSEFRKRPEKPIILYGVPEEASTFDVKACFCSLALLSALCY